MAAIRRDILKDGRRRRYRVRVRVNGHYRSATLPTKVALGFTAGRGLKLNQLV